MARKTRTDWFCDRCEVQVETGKDLQRVFISTKTTYRSTMGFALCLRCREILTDQLPASVTEYLGWTEAE